MNELGLPENTFHILRELIHERAGLYFENGKREMLAQRLAGRVLEIGMTSFLDYYYLLKYDGAGTEWSQVMDLLAVPETYFWREIDQLEALSRELVPQVLAAAPERPVRIWSAACASGEEPLTIAMVLSEAGWFGRAAIEIAASDASPAAIARARRGVYRERSFRALPERLRDKYFTPAPGGWQVAPALHTRVNWCVANLLDEAAVARLAAPIIVCRNVFIYFSEQTTRRVVEWFYRYMPSPGFLCIGVSESLVRLGSSFQLEEIAGSFVYVKG